MLGKMSKKRRPWRYFIWIFESVVTLTSCVVNRGNKNAPSFYLDYEYFLISSQDILELNISPTNSEISTSYCESTFPQTWHNLNTILMRISLYFMHIISIFEHGHYLIPPPCISQGLLTLTVPQTAVQLRGFLYALREGRGKGRWDYLSQVTQ